MKKLSIRWMHFIVAFILVSSIVASMWNIVGQAADCTISVSANKSTVNIGETFSVTISVSGSDVGVVSGSLSISGGASAGNTRVYLYKTYTSETYELEATSAGPVSISVSVDNAISFTTEQPMTCDVGSCTVTVVSPTEPPTEPPTTQAPTEPPTTQAPTEPPTTQAPTQPPTEPPTTQAPTQAPTEPPTDPPTEPPTEEPTDPPTEPPTTAAPTTEAPTTTAEELSNNAYLEALSIYPGKMTPAFDRNKLIYEATVSDEVTKLSVSATTEHPDATYIIVETTRENGNINWDIVYDIKVTAQDGKTVLWYAIRVTKEKDATTTQAPTTAAPTTAEPTTEEPTTEEPTTPADPLEVVIGSMTGRVQETLKGVKAPEGYEEKTYNYNGVEIKALKGLANGLVLIPVSDGQSVNLYLYNEANGGLYPYVGIQITSALYTVLPFDEDEQMPNGYKRTFVEFGGRVVDAWIREDAPSDNYVVFYAMNWQGNRALYRYDAEENTLQRVSKDEIAVPTTAEPTEPSTEKPENTTGANTGNQGGAELDSQRVAYYEEQIEKLNRRGTIMFVIMVVLLLCLIAMYLLFTSSRKDVSDDDDDSDDGEDTIESDEDFDEDEADWEEPDLDEFDDLDAEEFESDDMMAADDAEQLEKELENIQLDMAGIVAAFEAEIEGHEVEKSEAEVPEAEEPEAEVPEVEKSEAEVHEVKKSETEIFEVEDVKAEDLELEDLELEDLELEDLELEDMDLDELELDDDSEKVNQ